MMEIRTAIDADQRFIDHIHQSAFPPAERALVASLAIRLLLEPTTPQTFSWVAQVNDAIAGHIAFSPIYLNNEQKGYLLAPLAVAPDNQNQGIGSQLVQQGVQQLSAMGVDILLVYGDPKYYSRFGFSEATAQPYLPPYDLQYPFGWQGLRLGDAHRSAPQAPSPAQSPTPITCVPALQKPALW